jgi:hypothetical protein
MKTAKKFFETMRLRTLGVRTGSNPNSSSFGINVTWLLGGGLLVGLLTALGGTLARFALLRRRLTQKEWISKDAGKSTP